MGLKLGIVTGGSENGVSATIRAYNLEKYISVVVSGDDVTHSKPAPDCYLLALQQLGCAPHECIAIEDTEHGLIAAAAAGIQCLAVPTEMSQHHDFQRATAVLPDMAAAVEYILDCHRRD
jgi:beta-phosphoglucomutase-like phosphatase (HAD superfamily)